MVSSTLTLKSFFNAIFYCLNIEKKKTVKYSINYEYYTKYVNNIMYTSSV